MATQRSFKTVDVFTVVPFKGNPVAVVLDATGLSTQQMQQIANWANLSESTFVVPTTAEGADYQVRIFTPASELPFAGHPTIGTAHALLEAGAIEAKDGVLVQQCGAGLIRLTVERDGDDNQSISFELPTPKFTALEKGDARELEAMLGMSLEDGVQPYLVDVGARWVIAELPNARNVLENRPDLQRMQEFNRKGKHTGVVIFGKYDADQQASIEVRAFAPACGVNEDPVCGSGNGAVAAYLRHTGKSEKFGRSFVATQGKVVGRAGVIRHSISDDAIRIGGSAVTCVKGTISV